MQKKDQIKNKKGKVADLKPARNPKGGSKAGTSDIQITKHVDVSSPKLYL